MTAPATKIRLAVVVSHPTQYYSPWFREFAGNPALELRVFYLWDFGIKETRDPRFNQTFKWDVDLLSGYESEFLPNIAKRPGAESFFGFHNPGIANRLKLWRPQAILLFGYNWMTHLRVILWARLHRVPLLFRGDSHLIGRSGIAPTKRLALKLIFAQFAAITYVGEANHEYFEVLGVPSRKLFFAPHSVDAQRFDARTPGLVERAAALRGRLGIAPQTQLVLFAGKFVADKQPLTLLEAFVRADVPGSAILFVGDGEQKPALLVAATRAKRSNVHFLPFANQSEMPGLLLSAQLFVLPSRGIYETWGLAVNEAMLLGVPCLVSDRVGCQRDLVIDGETGWVFEAARPEVLSDKLGQALTTLAEPDQAAVVRAAVRTKIARYSYSQTSAGVLSAARFALAQDQP